MIVLAVDPSVVSLGWACFDAERAEVGDRQRITSDAWRFGCLHPHGDDRAEKWIYAVTGLCRVTADRPISHFVAEWPMFFSSPRGRIAAQKGHTIELAGMVGYIAGRLGMSGERITLYTPAQWKGSVPKEATAAKFIRTFGETARAIARSVPDDTIDAIMIADYWLRKNYDSGILGRTQGTDAGLLPATELSRR